MKKRIAKTIMVATMFSILFSSMVSAMDFSTLLNMPTDADNYSVIFQSSIEQEFSDDIIVTITSGGVSHKTTLRSQNLYMAGLSDIPAGTYNLKAIISQATVGGEEEFEHPYYMLEFPQTITIREGELLHQRIELKLIPGVSLPNQQPTEQPVEVTPEPTTPPEQSTNQGFTALLVSIMRRSWFTFLLVVLALIVWGAFAIKKMIYKDLY